MQSQCSGLLRRYAPRNDGVRVIASEQSERGNPEHCIGEVGLPQILGLRNDELKINLSFLFFYFLFFIFYP